MDCLKSEKLKSENPIARKRLDALGVCGLNCGLSWWIMKFGLEANV